LKIFFAGAEAVVSLKYNLDLQVRHWLATYIGMTPRVIDWFYNHPDMELFLDSGAFSAWSIGETIDLDQYIAFCLRHRRLFSVIASLDVIGNAEASMRNYDTMVKAGLDDVLPAWHYGEPDSVMEYYCKKTDYVAIGGIVALATKPALRAAVISKAKAIADRYKCRVHIYGMTHIQLLMRFRDVYSVDSTSWKAGMKYARALSLSGHDHEYAGRGGRKHYCLDKYNIYKLLQLERLINDRNEQESARTPQPAITPA
jgi:hypothetical protein